MVDFIAAKTAPQQLGPTAAVADVAVWKMFWTLVRAGAPPVSHIDPGNGHLHVAGCPGQVRVRQAAVSSISTVEAQLLGRLLQAALLHPCHFRVGGPLPEFHQSLSWSALTAFGRRIAIADHGVLDRRGAATRLISSPQPRNTDPSDKNFTRTK